MFGVAARVLMRSTRPSKSNSSPQAALGAGERHLLGPRERLPRPRSAAASSLRAPGAPVLVAPPCSGDRPAAPSAGAAALAGAVRAQSAVGTGYTVPTQLVFVPMLFLLPRPAVPLFVAAGNLLGDLPDYLRGRRHPERVVMASRRLLVRGRPRSRARRSSQAARRRSPTGRSSSPRSRPSSPSTSRRPRFASGSSSASRPVCSSPTPPGSTPSTRCSRRSRCSRRTADPAAPCGRACCRRCS